MVSYFACCLQPIIKQIREKNSKAIIHDVKGDFASSFEDENFMRIAPWDKRGAVWDIAKDCTTKIEAREVARCFVKEGGSDPMWSNSARMIFVTFILKLIEQHGNKWTWRDLADCMTCTREELADMIENYNPEAGRLVSKEESKTTDSILINLDAFLAPIHDLADIWGHHEGLHAFSIKEFLDDEYSGLTTVVFQSNQAYDNILTCLYPAILRIMAGFMNGPYFPDSKTRAIWFILDEFPQLGKLENFGPILETGRSKGLRGILGCQDIKQIEKLYSKVEMESWTGLMATWIVGRIANGPTAEVISKVVGQRTVEQLKLGYKFESWKDNSISSNYQELKLDVMPAADFSRVLTVDKTGIIALLLVGAANGVYKLKWGFTDVTPRREVVVDIKGEDEPVKDPEAYKKANAGILAKLSMSASGDTGSAAGEGEQTGPAANDEKIAADRAMLREFLESLNDKIVKLAGQRHLPADNFLLAGGLELFDADETDALHRNAAELKNTRECKLLYMVKDRMSKEAQLVRDRKKYLTILGKPFLKTYLDNYEAHGAAAVELLASAQDWATHGKAIKAAVPYIADEDHKQAIVALVEAFEFPQATPHPGPLVKIVNADGVLLAPTDLQTLLPVDIGGVVAIKRRFGFLRLPVWLRISPAIVFVAKKTILINQKHHHHFFLLFFKHLLNDFLCQNLL